MNAMTRTMRYSQNGLSIVELMVAMVIGLISMLVLTQVGVTFEEQKRTTVSGGDSLDASAMALGLMQRTLLQAGFGINDEITLMCTVNGFRETPGVVINSTLRPVEITQGGGSASDVVNIRAGNARRFAETGLVSSHTGDGSPFVTEGNYGFSAGDVFVVVEEGVAGCTLAEISSAPLNATDIPHQAGSSRYNNPAGSGIAYGPDARLVNLGPNPTLNQLVLTNGQLRLNELLSGTTTELLDDVITLQAQYGFKNSAGVLVWSDTVIDADGDGVISNAGDWLRLHAVRIAVLLRQGKMDRPNSSGVCNTSPASIPWSFGSFDVSALDNGRCYRYRAVEAIVPLRNMMWSPS